MLFSRIEKEIERERSWRVLGVGVIWDSKRKRKKEPKPSHLKKWHQPSTINQCYMLYMIYVMIYDMLQLHRFARSPEIDLTW
jgi:hypothetical protein